MKRQLLLLTILTLSLVGCKTREAVVNVDTQGKVERQAEERERKDTKVSVVTTQQTTDKSSERTEVKTTTTKTTYSKPDSIGRQHVESVEVSESHTYSASDADVTEQEEEQVEGVMEIEVARKGYASSDEVAEMSVMEKVERHVPVWLYIVGWGIFVGLFLVVILVIKRYTKWF